MKLNEKMRTFALLGVGVCVIFAFTSCKSSKSAYKKAYEKAKEQELAASQTSTAIEEVTPVVTPPVVGAPVEAKVVESTQAEFRKEKVTVVTGASDGLLDYSVVCGSFGVKANADNLKSFLDSEGYQAMIVFNAEKATYRVIVGTFFDKASAVRARDAFKARYPSRQDFQDAWLLYRID